MSLKRYVVVDLETTGLSKHYHKITEIAAVKVRDDEIVDQFQTLVNPETKIPGFITKLTGISNDMVRHAPVVKKVLPHFLDFMGSDIMVAHNATFDHGFLDQNAKKHLEVNFRNDRLCTKKLANRLLPDLPSKRLSCVCEHFNIVNETAHRAMSDVLATNSAFQNMLNMLHEFGIKEEGAILKFESDSVQRIREQFHQNVSCIKK